MQQLEGYSRLVPLRLRLISLRAVVLVALTICAPMAGSACGGSGAPASSSPGSARQRQLDAFLGAVQPLRVRGNAAAATVNATLAKVTGDDVSDWPAYAQQLKPQAADIRQIGSKVTAITAPAVLSAKWAGYASTYGTQATVLDQIASDLAGKDAAAVSRWNTTVLPRLRAGKQQAQAFRLALIAYAARYHLELPAWAKRIGSGKN